MFSKNSSHFVPLMPSTLNGELPLEANQQRLPIRIIRFLRLHKFPIFPGSVRYFGHRNLASFATPLATEKHSQIRCLSCRPRRVRGWKCKLLTTTPSSPDLSIFRAILGGKPAWVGAFRLKYVVS